MNRSLRSGVLHSLEVHAERTALSIDGRELSYRELGERARRVAFALGPLSASRLTAVFGHRHETAFVGILGALMRGGGYVPLNPVFPADRTAVMLESSSVTELVVDPTAYDKLVEVAGFLSRRLTIVAPDADEATRAHLEARLPGHRVLGMPGPVSTFVPGEASSDDVAYLLFTSGSTGIPKGVRVAHRNVVAFLDVMLERYSPTPDDRFSQTFDLTFDLSVFDIFMAWWSGACLCVPTAAQKAFPGKYALGARISVWFSVPSTAVLMNKLRMLRPDAYPSIRYALFCGEALPNEVADAFARAAPNAQVENLYGPTELTIACTLHRWEPLQSREESELGVVPIGEPYPGMTAKVVDESLREVADGEAGELVMTGPQLTLGYLNDPEKTAQAFVTLPDSEQTYYRTGDRVRRRASGMLVYLGRVDNQIKIQGYRVELGEIEAVLREASGSEVAIALGWPRTASGADGVVGFVSESARTAEEIRSAAAARLPGYMQPQRVVFVRDWPLNANGKVDRKALLATLETA
jgi:amino acid adenylation domain-containing protein